MARLNWGAAGERFYELGVDQGVLYVGDSPGVAWTGLTSVSESPTGGEARAYYIDGVKYLNLSSAEEFEATINAFSSPPEFGPCDGTVSIQNGLFVTQQPRKQFGFSYRTKIGNDVDGTDHAHKIHLVYNALAAPSGRDNNTVGDSTDPASFGWAITTLPPAITGFKPTAHFVIDSRKTLGGLLRTIEDILYGSDSAASRFPTVQELIDMFKSEGPLLYRNLMTNPSFRIALGTTEIRRNLAVDPRATSSTTPLTSLGWRSGRWFGNNAQTGTNTWVTGAVDGWSGIGTYMRKTWTAPLVTTTTADTGFDAGRTDVTPGEFISVSGRLRASLQHVGRIAFYWYDSGGVQIGRTNADSQQVTLLANTWTKVFATTQVPTNLSGLVKMGVVVDIGAPGNTVWAVGATLDGTALLVERSDASLTYFDGTTSPDDAGWVFSWTGTPNASASILTAPKIAAGNLIPYTPYVVGGQAGTDRLRILHKIGGQSLLAFGATSFAASPEDFHAARMQVRQIGGSSAVSVTGQIRYYDSGAITIANSVGVDVSVPVNSDWVDLIMPSQNAAPSGTALTKLVLLPKVVPVGTYLEVRQVLMSKVDGANVDPPTYFDGSIPDADAKFYSWEGTPDASTSVINTWDF